MNRRMANEGLSSQSTRVSGWLIMVLPLGLHMSTEYLRREKNLADEIHIELSPCRFIVEKCVCVTCTTMML